jgi:ATP-dependent Lon protease
MTIETFPVLFLDDVVILPGMALPIELTSQAQATLDAARAAVPGRKPGKNDPLRLLLVPRIDGHYGVIGSVVDVIQIGRLPSGEPAAVLRASQRARIGHGVTGTGAALWVEAELLEDPASSAQTRERAAEFKQVLTSILQQRNAWQVLDAVQRMSEPAELSDIAGYASWIEPADKVRLLEMLDPAERLDFLLERGRAFLAELSVSDKIREDVQEGMEKTQREYLLRQQLAAIRKELGESDAGGGGDYRSRIEAADLPDNVRTAALAEADRLERSSDQSPESGWIRTWLDTVLDLPWTTKTTDTTDVKHAREVLDADHTGLDDVKERIVEHLAVRARRAKRGLDIVGGRGSGAVLVLVGPPGVGKTSLGESVAHALGRSFVRVALGGVRDEAEIRGHRRTYVGALPGRIVRALQEAGTMNPVVLLDEIDKVGSDYRGDPAAALLEVLDPAQNHTFRDHYLDVDLNLSDVVFLATANVLDTIPSALLDRMEVVRLDGYTEDEKVAIARDHLLPRQLERAGLTPEEVSIEDDALRTVAAEHTHEAGVRQLERAVARILRKVTIELADTEEKTAAPTSDSPASPSPTPDSPTSGDPSTGATTDQPSESETSVIVVQQADIVRYLGRPRFTPESAERTAVPGVATGLAVTGAGGDVLFVEATTMEGEPGLTLTGQLGDVMKESAQIALSYLRANGKRLGVSTEQLAHERVHVHFPAGAVPKDGPSAGVTLTTALASLLTGRLVRAEVGMTGEVSLTGRVLPIGGVKQKLLAAHRAGLTEVIIPARNGPDLDDLPAEVRDKLIVHQVSDVADVIAIALEPATAATRTGDTAAAA